MKLAILMLLLVGTLHAQELPFKPLPVVRVQLTDGAKKWYEPLAVPQKTADKAFLAYLGVSALSMIADCENTEYALQKPGASERNLLFGGRPGRAKCYGLSAPVFLGMGYYSYKYKREDSALAYAGLPAHRFVRWWVPDALNTAFHVVGVLVTLTSTGR
jgi:hypothetical protein